MEYSEAAGANQRVRVPFVMQLDLNNLPTDTALLHHLVRDMASVVEQRDDEIEQLQLIIKQLPDHLPREEVWIDVGAAACACCGGALHSIGESVSEVLDWVPAQFRVIRIC